MNGAEFVTVESINADEGAGEAVRLAGDGLE